VHLTLPLKGFPRNVVTAVRFKKQGDAWSIIRQLALRYRAVLTVIV